MKVSFSDKKHQDPTRVKGIRVPYAPARRTVSQWRWYLILAVVTSPLLYLLWKILTPYVMVTAQGYLSLEKISVNSRASGIVQQIHVGLGDPVEPGRPLVTLYNPDLLERRQVLKSEQETLTAKPVAMTTSREAALRQAVSLYQGQAAYQESLLNDIQTLYNLGAATIAELNLATSQADKAKTDLILARADLAGIRETRLQEQNLPDQEYLARKQRLDTGIAVVDDQLRRLVQVFDRQGRVLDVFVGIGESVSPGTPLMLIGQVLKPYAVVYLDPRHIRYARKGKIAVIRLPNGEKIRARVREDAELTRRIPADISSPVTARDIMILVKMDLIDPLPLAKNIDGLPVSIRFEQTWN